MYLGNIQHVYKKWSHGIKNVQRVLKKSTLFEKGIEKNKKDKK